MQTILKKSSFPKSAIVYQGPSRFDGAPIVAIVTGLHGDTKNPKTGQMAQLWIIRADMSPVDAIQRRADVSICFDCPARGTGMSDRWCYVGMKAPLAVWESFARGAYPTVEPSQVAEFLRAWNLPIRFGAYGEPTALPLSVLNDLAEGTEYTGYTHQWKDSHVARTFGHLLMASADTAREASDAQALGWRTFRARPADSPLMAGEISCPASDEMDKRTTCAKCTLCDGSRGANDKRRNVAIIVHGANKVQFLKVIR
jgi:hypothetical protein